MNCRGNFRGITERGKRKYICSQYHNYRSCIRKKVDESLLIELIQNHYMIELYKKTYSLKELDHLRKNFNFTDNLYDRVDSIYINPTTEEITIFYNNNTQTYISANRHSYWTENVPIPF